MRDKLQVLLSAFTSSINFSALSLYTQAEICLHYEPPVYYVILSKHCYIHDASTLYTNQDVRRCQLRASSLDAFVCDFTYLQSNVLHTVLSERTCFHSAVQATV